MVGGAFTWWSHFVRRFRQFQRKKLPIRLCEPDSAIQGLGGGIVSSGLDVYRSHASLGAEGAHLCQRRSTKPRTTKWQADKQIVHERIRAAVLHAVAQGQHHVADVLAVCLNEPHIAESIVSQQRREC